MTEEGSENGWLDRYFLLSERGSSVSREVRAGCASFLTMSYGLLVNPQMLALAGIPQEDAVVATAAASAGASLLVGLVGNLPFGLTPGVGLSSYLAYSLVLTGILDKTQALTCCMVAGFLVAACTLTGLSHYITDLTPTPVKRAIVVGMGLLIALIGLVSVDLVVEDEDSIVALGDLTDSQIILALTGLTLIVTLSIRKVPGALLLGIVLISFTYWVFIGGFPDKVVRWPTLEDSISDNISFGSLNSSCIMPILAFLFVMLFDVSGVMFGLSSLAGLQDDKGSVRGGTSCYLSCAAGTIMGGAMGTSPVICAVESAAGVEEGGRTGLTAVTVGLLFLSSLFFSPLFGEVPTCATSPVLVLVGAMMMKESSFINWNNPREGLPAFLCVAMMPFTYSIPNGILFGVGASLVLYFTTGDFLKACSTSQSDDDDDDENAPQSQAAVLDGTSGSDSHLLGGEAHTGTGGTSTYGTLAPR